jgi:cyclase
MSATATRREFLHAMSALAAAGFLPRIAHSARVNRQLHFANKELPGGAFVIGALADGGNVLVMPTEAGPIMIDCKFAHTAPKLAADVESLMKRKPVMLINTHHHADHSGGTWAFKESSMVIAHKNYNPRIENNLSQYAGRAQNHAEELKKSGANTATVDEATALAAKIKAMNADQFTAKQEMPDGANIITHGGVTMQVFHYGNGHTDNDLVIFFPKQNIIHMGDLLFHKVHAYIDRGAKADTRGWQNSLRQAMKVGDDKTVVVPGHGEVTDKTALTTEFEYFDQMREIVTNAIKEGKSREEVTAMNPEAFKDYGLEFVRAITLGGIYDEVKEQS